MLPISVTNKYILKRCRTSMLFILCILLGGIMFTGTFSKLALAYDNISVELNGQSLISEHLPILKDGITLVPLRVIFESLGVEVKWEESTKTITASRWQRNILMAIGQEQAYMQDKDQPQRQIKLNIPPQIINNVTYVPLRFVSESFGGKVEWNAQQRKVIIRTQSPPDANPWEYRILAGVTEKTVEAFGGMDAVNEMIVKQIEAVNRGFQNNAFIEIPRFTIRHEDIYQFEGDGRTESLNKFHSKHEYLLIYDAFPEGGGGWYGGEYQAIYHAWPTGVFGTLFESNATDGLVHEFAHAIGNALDLYAISVDAERNLISGTEYKVAQSIMDYPYGETVWDDHTIASINKAGGYPIQDEERYTAEQFPEIIEVLTLDRVGRPTPNVKIRLYPVHWFGNEVVSEPISMAHSGVNGVWKLEKNPFEPFSIGKPWSIGYANFLVEVEYPNGNKHYNWMPVDQVQLHRYRQPDQSYRLTFRDS